MEDNQSETELVKMLEQEHNIELNKIQEDPDEQDDIFDQSYDIDEFEKKMKKMKSKRKGSDDSEDDKEKDSKLKQQRKNANSVQFQQKTQSIEQIQSKIITQQKAKVQQSEEYQIAELLKSGNDGLKEKKIKELLTRNRNIQVQCEKEKQLRIKLEGQLNQIIKDNEEALQWKNLNKDKENNLEMSAKSTMKQTQSKDDTISKIGGEEDWKKKFQDADKKIQEMRVKNQNVKSDLNKAERIIAREIGENFEIDKVLMEENGWKGRAQQIDKLKSKVRDLQSKLGNTITNNTSTSGFSETGGMGGGQFQFGIGQQDPKAAEQRRKDLELLKELNEKLKNENELLSSKVKAVSSRKTILENEVKDIKTEYDKNKKILIEKSENDDKYIKALKQEIDKLRKQKAGDTKVIYKNNCEHDHRDPEDYEIENQKLKKEISYFKEEIDQKEKMIKELIQEKIKQGTQSYQNGGGKDEASILKLEAEIKILKKEREEFFKSNIADQDTRQIIKDLSIQNAKLRAKLDDFKQQKK